MPPREGPAVAPTVERFPYVPSDPAKLAENCYEAYNIQVQGLVKRLQATGTEKVVIGVSGGLDSTQALLVCSRRWTGSGCRTPTSWPTPCLALPRASGTKGNAWALMRALGVTRRGDRHPPGGRQMLADIGHPFADGKPVYDVTFENVQAGERTDYLFRLANHNGALVVGTGDLSELALGWCTYGVGDHMSHYNVNASVPKTLIQHLIRFVAASGDVDQATADILQAILATEISPELVPQETAGAIQSTESMVGPYPLQDFNLFYLTRYGFRPSKIAYLSWCAWSDAAAGTWPSHIPAHEQRSYRLGEIEDWLRLFLQRFFTNQFKRTAMPNGPKISSGGSLSPRGDWRAPSDASPSIWLEELDRKVPDQKDD